MNLVYVIRKKGREQPVSDQLLLEEALYHWKAMGYEHPEYYIPAFYVDKSTASRCAAFLIPMIFSAVSMITAPRSAALFPSGSSIWMDLRNCWKFVRE